MSTFVFPSRGCARLASALICAVLLPGLLRASTAAPTHPNILIIMPDQMRASAMGISGNADVQTPNIDELAREGTRFRNTYANNPVCCPARAILLTGTYPQVNGMMVNDMRLRESERTIAEILDDAGYRTGFVGKWHLDGGPREPGFVPPGPRRQGFEFWRAYECNHQHFKPYYYADTPQRIVVPKFEPEATCDFAVDFLKTQPAEQPFLLFVQLGPPHNPYGAPSRYLDRYPVDKITPPPNWQPNSEHVAAARSPKHWPESPGGRYVPTGGKEEIAAYYAAITAIDDQVGRLLRTLKETGQDQNTIILFIADHGDMLGSHGLRRKRKPYDESAHIPGIMRWPGHIPAHRMVETLFSHVDMPPTLLRLAGIVVPDDMQGADLSRVALGETTAGPDAVLLQQFVPFPEDNVSHPWRGIVTARYTYARYADAPWVLFDRQADPWEMKNLANDPERTALRQELDTRLAALMRKEKDSWAFDIDEDIETGGDFYRDRAFYTVEEYRAWKDAHRR